MIRLLKKAMQFSYVYKPSAVFSLPFGVIEENGPGNLSRHCCIPIR